MKATQRIREVLKLSKTNKKLKPCKLIMLYIFQARIGFRKADRITKVGFTLTFIWLLTIFATSTFRNKPVWCLSLNEFGDFLAGSFAPLAFFWFVIGYFQQGKELQLQREELALQRQEFNFQGKQAKRQADASERHLSLDEEGARPILTYLTTQSVPSDITGNRIYKIKFQNHGGKAINAKHYIPQPHTHKSISLPTVYNENEISVISIDAPVDQLSLVDFKMSYEDLRGRKYQHLGTINQREDILKKFFDDQKLIGREIRVH